VTKFLDKSFSSRPASQEYRDRFEQTFGKSKKAKARKRGGLVEFIDRVAKEVESWPGWMRGKPDPVGGERKTLRGKRK
jgi:hypothetical protein